MAEAARYEPEKTVAVVMSGTGIALGICQNRVPFEGGCGFAGELGYSVTRYSGRNTAVLSRLAGGAAILEKAGCPPEELWSGFKEEKRRRRRSSVR